MYAVEVRDRIMIAHSFRGEMFGPAQALHGATFVIDAAFLAESLDPNGVVIDIGRAHEVLRAIVKDLNYRNLDDIPEFGGFNTTTEFLTKYVFDRLAGAARNGGLARDSRELTAIRVTISESDVARAWYGGYAYDRRMIAELRQIGWNVEIADIGSDFPRPSPRTMQAARERLAAVPKGIPIVIDGLAFGVLPELAAELHVDHPLIALVHHPLALESGISAAEAGSFRAQERAALAFTDNVVVTSATTGRLLAADYGVEPDDITVAMPGNDPKPPTPGRSSDRISLLSVGSLVRRKGYDVLVAALAGLADLRWRLTIVGDRTRDPATASMLDADIHRHGLGDRIDVLGAVPDERLNELYAAADLFVLPSRFEGYGMAFAEAMAHGLPIIGTDAGAIPETVPAEAGILVPAGDAAALRRALRAVLEDPALRATFSAGARRAAAALPRWDETVRRWGEAFDRLVA
jgi:glycosyltransferase involved in cell wall biosynthesis